MFQAIEGRDVSATEGRVLPANLSAAALPTLRQDPDTVILDIRSRDEFRNEHKPLAINIPIDELDVRLVPEIPRTKKIVIDCSAIRSNVCEVVSHSIQSKGFRYVSLLNSGTFADPRCR